MISILMFIHFVLYLYIFSFVLRSIETSTDKVQFILVSDSPNWSKSKLSPNMSLNQMSHVYAEDFHQYLPQDIQV